jgi:hypothetical protein
MVFISNPFRIRCCQVLPLHQKPTQTSSQLSVAIFCTFCRAAPMALHVACIPVNSVHLFVCVRALFEVATALVFCRINATPRLPMTHHRHKHKPTQTHIQSQYSVFSMNDL